MTRVLSVLLTLFFLFLLIHRISEIGVEKILRSLSQVHLSYFTASVCLMLLSAFFQGCRWSMILLPLRKFAPWQTFISVTIGHWFNAVLPARLGELARPYHFSRKHNLSFSTMFATTVIERIFDLFCMFTLAVVGLAILSLNVNGKMIIFMLFVCIIFLSFFILFAIRGELLNILVKALPGKSFRRNIEIFLQRFFDGVRLLRNKGQLIAVSLFTAMVWGTNIAVYWLLLRSCNLPPPVQTPPAAVAVTFAGAVTHAIPSSVAGLGVVNYGVVVALEHFASSINFDISPFEDSVLTASIVIYIAALLPDIFIGGFFYWKDKDLFVAMSNVKI